VPEVNQLAVAAFALAAGLFVSFRRWKRAH
jgi:hypothetical protein